MAFTNKFEKNNWKQIVRWEIVYVIASFLMPLIDLVIHRMRGEPFGQQEFWESVLLFFLVFQVVIVVLCVRSNRD